MASKKILEQKQTVIDEIKMRTENAKTIVLFDYRGITDSEAKELRIKLKESNSDYKVYKNTMMNFAVDGTQFEGLKEYFKGPSALAICYEDPTTAAGILSKFKKEAKVLEFKAGVIEGVCYDAKGMEAVADIPSREVLLSKLLGSFKSPMGSFARVIKAYAEKKEEA